MLPHSYSFSAIGTSWRIDSGTAISDAAKAVIARRIEQFDRTYSRFRSDSLVRQVAETAGTYHFPRDVVPLVQFYHQLYELTGHRVTPLIGATLERAGYDAAYSFMPQPQQTVPDWEDVMRWTENTVTTTRPALLDLGAAGKGYLIDLLVAIIRRHGVKRFVIDGSGDLYVHDEQSHVIGLEDPTDAARVIGAVRVANGSLCASATNRRAWGEEMHHIFDPATRRPVFDVIATWVIAETALLADGIATALFFVPPEQLLPSYSFHYVRMLQSGVVEYSTHLPGEIFS